MKTFSIREVFQFGWVTFKKHPWIYIGISLISVVVNSLGDLRFIGPIFYIVSIGLTMGYMKIGLNAVDGIKPSFGVFFSEWSKFGRFIGVMILFLLMLIIPALVIIFAFRELNIAPNSVSEIIFLTLMTFAILAIVVRYYFSTYLIIDRNVKILESLKMSRDMTKGHRLKILLFMLGCIMLILIGVAALIVGLLISVAIMQISMAYIYRKILQTSNVVIPAASDPDEATISDELIATKV